jgi:quercetin dioxygenase-like cupin family protein
MKRILWLCLLVVWGAGCATAPVPAARTETPGAPALKPVATLLVRTTKSWDGSPLPAYPGKPPEITVMHIVIPPGASLPSHRHPVINVGYLVRGELHVVTEAGARLHLKAGDPIVEVVGAWHQGRNEGTEPAEIVVVYAGFAAEPITEYQRPAP